MPKSFDRAVHYYDSTRGFPPEHIPIISELLTRAGGLTATSHVLEIGIGTGRMALPLLPHVGGITGVDIAPLMIEALRAKPGGDQIRLALADSAHLPFVDASFDAVLLVHILHLVDDLDGTMREMRRILKPDGVILSGWSRSVEHNLFNEMRQLWQQEMTEAKRDNWDKVESAFERTGFQRRTDDFTHEYIRQHSPQNFIDKFAERMWSSTWDWSDAEIESTTAKLRTFALERVSDLNAPIDNHEHFTVHVYHL